MPQVAATAAIAYMAAQQSREQQAPYIDAITNAANTQGGVAKSIAPYAPAFYQRAMETFDPAASYYRAAAAGGPQLLAATAGRSAEIGDKYSTLFRTGRELYPRSGARNMWDLAFRAGDEKQALRNTEQSNAINALVN